ncbi:MULTISPECIES: TIGR00282 family metallophosphoesterase [Paenibacillus]|uniref:TIGR00282 family metallophosphoesterase n=1 Tax=Paenibacillus radicis (ex Xue et al. 2023) TaxID=2972489 RepID=A0ABT1YCS1_9BACL|nr:TIGR00282 family metallophosphoesterase [Paenibacillus radicis (ex Xue et al. 2023)]MCR8630732.1 TIGR00282 family metallophosphoesterase [Paenibacillus radicis (ex Xue et al. 2023)]
MRILFIGDIVGSVGRKAVKACLPRLKTKLNPTFIIANGENAAAGRGITAAITKELFELGVHGITMGNHTWDQKDIFDFIDDEDRMVRPANFPKGTPGRGFTTIKVKDQELLIINLQGRTFLPPLDCPFEKVDSILESQKKKHKYVLVDFHAEATSEKLAMGWHLDGKVSAVVGTHTHVQTHDERLLPSGTAYVTDVGMVGPQDGILGMERTAVMQKFRTQLPVRFVVDEGKWHFHAVCIDLDPISGLGKKIQLIRMDEDQLLFE